MRYLLELSYDGSRFAGWQVQTRQKVSTVQGILNEALSTILRQEISCTGSGRTDAGVHAHQTFAHFDVDQQQSEHLLFQLNGLLPREIAVRKLYRVPDDLHARYSATARQYKYFMHFHKDPFLQQTSTFFPARGLDVPAMRMAISSIKRFSDFGNMSKRNEDLEHTLCEIQDVHWEHNATTRQLIFCITANRFLHGMVRRIVGTLVSIGRGKMTVEDWQEAMKTQQSLPTNYAAPPQGLHLWKITYPQLKDESASLIARTENWIGR